MKKELLKLTPTRYLCPFCGKWYKWKEGLCLGDYDDEDCEANWACSEDYYTTYSFYFSNDYLYYYVEPIMDTREIEGKIPISSIKEDSVFPRVTFNVHCEDIVITLGFEFEESDYNSIVKTATTARKEKEQQKQDSDIKEQVSQRPQVKENKEDTTMTNNNIFNMNVECGPNKDENIASTIMGIAVKNGDSWRIYDKKKKKITDIGNMQLGNFPIFIIPTTKLTEGDLIKDAGEYYFVNKVDKESTQTLCAKTGEIKTVIPIKNVLGFSCYSKVIALSDSLNIGDDSDVEKLAIMSAMCGQSDENSSQMNQLLPLMLMKDKFGGDDDTMKLILMSSMMTSEKDGGQMNQLLPLMLLKDKFGGDDDMMKLMLMSSMSGDNMAGSNNPLMNYLMLDTFMGKKEDNASQKTDEETAE